MKSLVSKSKHFQSQAKVEIHRWARREEWLHEPFQIEIGVPNSDTKFFIRLIQCIRFSHEKFGI